MFIFLSLPTRERGLKYNEAYQQSDNYLVAPYTGAWIEIKPTPIPAAKFKPSLPTRERGLKYHHN